MARRSPLDREAQDRADMLELLGSPAFRRFLFTVAEKAGICASAYGSNIDTSKLDGRRSLGIEILEMADDALPVRDDRRRPFTALAMAISEPPRYIPPSNGADDENETPASDDYEPSR